jgi:hypothetical protein
LNQEDKLLNHSQAKKAAIKSGNKRQKEKDIIMMMISLIRMKARKRDKELNE